MKHRRLPNILVAIFIGVLTICGTVMAYMYRQTEYKENAFTPVQVSCSVVEKFDGENKTSIQVKNTGNIDTYIRVRFVSYWVRKTEDGSSTEIVAKPSSMPEIVIAKGWIKGSDDTYYYCTPVAPGELTGEMLSSPIQLKEDENGYLQVVEVFAEAIQSKPSEAVTISWGVTIGENGITVVP